MSGDIQSRVYGWIDQQLVVVPGRPPLTGLRLAHLNAADQLQQIAHYPASGDAARVQELKIEIFRTANEVAVQWSGFQRFALQAFFGDEQSPAAYLPFSLSGQDQPAAALSATEPPNMYGLVRQSMRHTEAMAKIAAGLMADGNANVMRQNALLAEQLERTQERFHALLERSEQILAHADERADARARTERAEKRKDEIAHRLLEALPVITNKISEKFGGPKLFAPNAGGGGQPPGDQVLADMLASLSDDTFDQMLACFPNPLHKAYVMELYKRLVLDPHKRKQAAAAAVASPTNGGKADAH